MVQALCPVAVAYAESDNVTVPTTSACTCIVQCTLLFIGTIYLTRIAQNEKIFAKIEVTCRFSASVYFCPGEVLACKFNGACTRQASMH